MISLTKQHICSITSTISKRYYRVSGTKIDPGINRRKKVVNPMELQDEGEDIELDDIETDFMDVHKSYKQHIKETNLKKEHLKYLIVKNKYFKEKYPNFLTWNDKEQIRLLHNTDPEEWTVEKLSESFPALPDIVKKILNAKYSKSETKVKRHDSVVEQNWDNFRNGKLTDLPCDLVEHLNKFTRRTIHAQYFNKKMEVINRPKVKSEFLDIITSYTELKNKKENIEHNENIKVEASNKNNHNAENTYLTIKKQDIKDKRLITLSELESKIEIRANKGAHLSQEEKVILKDVNSHKNHVANMEENLVTISKNKFNSKAESSLMKKPARDYSHLIYPENIIIPKELKKKGYTYKLNDCYYDYDGEFLYRVPGMD